MNRISLKIAMLLATAAPLIAAMPSPASAAEASVEAAVRELLDTDRAFAAASAATNVVDGLAAMFDESVVMPLRTGTLATRKADAVAFLRANPANATVSADWAPIRGGVSADGQHGFTYGYMTQRQAGGPAHELKYLSYWVKRPEGWRVAAFKRAPRGAGAATPLLPPVLPARAVAPGTDPAVIDAHRASLGAAERAFAAEAQVIGVGPAFAKYGSPDAMNMGTGPGFTLGADNISRDVGAGAPQIDWGPDGALVASSGDLGVTWGLIRRRDAAPGEPAIPFFTIWHRADPAAPWRYVAE